MQNDPATIDRVAVIGAGLMGHGIAQVFAGHGCSVMLCYKVKFEENHFSRCPLMFGQWFKTDKPEQWELKVAFSKHDFLPTTGNSIFPKPFE